MNRSTRGVAYVSLMWVVVLVVLLLVSIALIYVVNSDRAQVAQLGDTYKKKVGDQETQIAALTERGTKISRVVGFRDEADPHSDSNPDQVAERLGKLREQFGLGADAKTTMQVLEGLEKQLQEEKRLKTEAEDARKAAETARTSLQQDKDDSLRKKDEAYAELQKQLQTERDRHASQEQQDKDRNDDMTKRLADAESRAKADKDAAEKAARDAAEQIKVREGRITELSKKTEFIRLPDKPDGSVVGASTTDRCWIDLGSKQLLRRGQRFKVFTYAKNGEMHEKGMIEVAKVDESMAEATVVELKDRFDPISKGDLISAPNYDPSMPREFVLDGRFPSGYSRGLVADRLRALGAKVADKVGPSTDFLVMGDRDEAPGEGGQVSADEQKVNEDLRLAQLYRVQIMPVREILEFVKYE